jgi:hypothetical protein
MFPNGRTATFWPRLIGNGGGGVVARQKSVGLSVVGQVRSALNPPESVIAKSLPHVFRIASVTVLPTSDSHRCPFPFPHESARGMKRVEASIC